MDNSATNFKLIVILLCFVSVFRCVLTSCDDSQLSCDNGSCIADDLKCDGKEDCTDRSDEIAQNCIKHAHNCPVTSFACSYGACIEGKKRCDGNQDCADNSDELACSQTEGQHWHGQCGSEQMQCLQSKECISMANICDGYSDCSDGADESVGVCAAYPCPPIAFRCSYGGCVNSVAKCNGTAECADGSDEAWELCGAPRKTFNSRIKRSAATTTDDDECQIPEDLTGFKFKLHPSNITVLPGSWLVDSETLHIECANGAQIEGPSSLLCDSGKFDLEFPTCSNYCDAKLLQGLSTKFFYHNNNSVDGGVFQGRIPLNTIVEVSCAIGFRRRFGRKRQLIRCLPNGTFDRKREPCAEDCGRPSPLLVPWTKYSSPIKPSSVPWHVAIYEVENDRSIYICTGSVVSPTIVLSAAHCFWDTTVGLKKQPHLFKLVAGKYTREFNSYDDGNPQMRDVASIHISEVFRGRQNQSLADIAVIKLKSPLVYNDNISAICLPQVSGDADDFVDSNIKGIVTGYGLDNTLKQADMVTRNLQECRKKATTRHISGDKFCLYNQEDGRLCRGDRGAGFAVKLNGDYHLLGITSYATSTESDCALNGFGTVTNVRYMQSDLREIMRNELLNDILLY